MLPLLTRRKNIVGHGVRPPKQSVILADVTTIEVPF